MQTKNKATPVESRSGLVPTQPTSAPKNYSKPSPRMRRLAELLLEGAQTLHELIHLLPDDNPQDFIRRLRRDYGINIAYTRVRFTTRLGDRGWYGLYHLTPPNKKKLRAILNQFGAESNA